MLAMDQTFLKLFQTVSILLRLIGMQGFLILFYVKLKKKIGPI